MAVSGQQGARRSQALVGRINLAKLRVCGDRWKGSIVRSVEMLMAPPDQISSCPSEQLFSRTLPSRHRTRLHIISTAVVIQSAVQSVVIGLSSVPLRRTFSTENVLPTSTCHRTDNQYFCLQHHPQRLLRVGHPAPHVLSRDSGSLAVYV